MRRISLRAQLAIAAAMLAVFGAAFAFLVPPASALSDAEYIAMAKGTPQGQRYFARYPATCEVYRVWTVQIACDYVAPGTTQTQKFRVHVDARSNSIIDVEADFTP